MARSYALALGIGAVYVAPTGDSTGAADKAAINTALQTGDVMIAGDYVVNGDVVIPSNRTLFMGGATLRLANGSNRPLVRNENLDTSDSRIGVVGLGSRHRNVLDGNGINQTRQTGTNQWKNVLALFVNVDYLQVANVTTRNPNAWGISPQLGCSNVRLENIESEDDGSSTNCSPIQVYGACTDLVIDGVYGTSQDDCVALLTYTKSQVGAYGYTLAGGNISRVEIRNLSGTWGTGSGVPLRFLNGDGFSITDVAVDGVHQFVAMNAPHVLFGPTSYVTTKPTAAQCSNFTIRNLHTVGTTVNAPIVAFDQACQQVDIDGVHCTGLTKGILGTVNASGSATTITNVRCRNVDVSSLLSNTGALISFPATYTVQNLYCRNWGIQRASNILANAGTLTDIDIKGIHLRIAWGVPFNSTVAETGSIDDVQVDLLQNGVTTRWAGPAMKLRMGANMPILDTGDVTPSAATKGSRLLASHNVDPGGLADGKGGEYVADGAAWKRVVDLGVSF